ncbi:hypothetical protein PHSY_007405 [Pseudozyma hubeiensis SY62]|uniref:Uncharacterized protein n=1 Tax=Pseudozyma hubeiensis (strain SY62) TaxID=1305764 RepID=R9PEY4_PSEHS|nr:hypothetical protein PHSY_007405 [Pseudozyma hubeiensis SY62]GAC99802.1 hypothetical protein PHSY_007405 [Pseudozyma hubeiensis SY62]
MKKLEGEQEERRKLYSTSTAVTFRSSPVQKILKQEKVEIRVSDNRPPPGRITAKRLISEHFLHLLFGTSLKSISEAFSEGCSAFVVPMNDRDRLLQRAGSGQYKLNGHDLVDTRYSELVKQ